MAGLLCLGLPSSAWAQAFGEFVSPGVLASDHEELSGITQCVACHDLGGGVSASKCMSCHEHVEQQVQTKTGFHTDKGQTCESCHPDHRGAGAALTVLIEQSFDHSKTGFDLLGSHAPLDCAECHTADGTFVGLEQACATCHDDPHNHLQARAQIGRCESCHTDVDWEVAELVADVFNHNDPLQADFNLLGKHAEVACDDCHDDMVFVPVVSDTCTDCHDDLHRGQFDPRTCEDCHTVETFALRGFDHDTTDYPLDVGHRDVSCESCHGDDARAVYVDLPHETCSTCHDDPHDGQFAPRECDACHSVGLPSFAMAGFDHDETEFPLLNAHGDVGCADCHGEGPGGTFASLPFDDCSTCHEDPHESSFDPARCDSCHTDGLWDVESFDHDQTSYPLTGAHTEVGCADCHGEGEDHQLSGLAFETCADCHADEEPHEGTLDVASCSSCHQTDEWALVAFEHLEQTGFALSGKHEPVGCMTCHEDPSFVLPGAECEVCHLEDEPADHYDGACADCHLPEGWLPASLRPGDHAKTGLALRGAHASTECIDCHADPSPGPFCADCHATDDPHRNLLGDTCDTCHAEVDWLQTRFNHASTGFPLRGSHRLATCNDCHAAGFSGAPSTCRRCHDNERPRDALHSDPLTRECETCHRPYTWDGVLFVPPGGF